MASKMTEVAKLLGVELGEIFKVTDDTFGEYRPYHRFTKSAGIEISDDGVEWERATALVLKCLLMGDVRIVKLPWKPSHGDEYWTPIVNQVAASTLWSKWSNIDNDRYRYEHGLICRTKEEANELTEKLLAMAKEGKNNG